MHLGVLDLIYRRAGMYRTRAAVSSLRAGKWSELRFEDVQRGAQHLSNYLIDNGIEHGDRIAIVSESNAEFGIVFFAVVRAGAILVPLDPKQTVEELTPLILDSGPKIIFASTKCQNLAAEVAKKCPLVSDVIITDSSSENPASKTIQSVSTHILQEGRERDLEETALIVYTSGSTGKPKGVMTTFNNLIFQAERLEELFDAGKKDVFLSILPMNHLLELTAGYLGVLYSGGQVCYISSLFPEDILKAMRSKKVTYMIVVPTFMRLMKNSIERMLAKSDRKQQLNIRLRFGLARLLPLHARRKLFPRVHALIGSQFRSFISGGAPLSKDIAYFFDTLGIKVCQGYGLTETSPIISTNSHKQFRLCSVGKPLPGIEVRLLGAKGIGDVGEIVTKGPHIMRGYYRREDLTNVAIDQAGWFYTGDLGSFDDDGFLFVTGRIKDLIVLPGGKKVYPEEVEQVLSASTLVKEICVLGVRQENNPEQEEVVAVVVPVAIDEEESVLTKSLEDLMTKIAVYKRPSRIVISPDNLPRTHSGKVKRNLVIEWLKKQEAARR